MRILIVLLLSTYALLAQEKYVTVTLPVEQIQGLPYYRQRTNIVQVLPGETAQLASLMPPPKSLKFPELWIERDGNQSWYYKEEAQSAFSLPLYPLVVAGPAVIKLIGGGGMATFKITPDQYPPDKTMVLPGGPGGANVTMECSTNLVHWTPANNGAYTNLPGVKFFRIKLDRIQP